MTNNALALVALCNEYCAALQAAEGMTARELAMQMQRLLPRIYISAADLPVDSFSEAYIDAALDEESYDALRRRLETVFGEHDTYLEVFEEDMKYSDTPIGASVAEGLADLFQVFYNMLEAVRDATDELAEEALAALAEDFRDYWSQTLVNVLRPINHIVYRTADDE